MFRQYFEDLAAIAEGFHSKSYKYTKSEEKDTDHLNPMLNMKVDLKTGFN